MRPGTAQALRETTYSLNTEAERADRRAEALREEADAWEQRAQGYREASGLIMRALDEDGDQ